MFRFANAPPAERAPGDGALLMSVRNGWKADNDLAALGAKNCLARYSGRGAPKDFAISAASYDLTAFRWASYSVDESGVMGQN